METIRNFRNITIIISAIFCWGIVGSIEIERMTLSDGVEKMLWACLFCVIVCAVEFFIKIARAQLIRYARRRRAESIRHGTVKRTAIYASR